MDLNVAPSTDEEEEEKVETAVEAMRRVIPTDLYCYLIQRIIFSVTMNLQQGRGIGGSKELLKATYL